MRTIDSLLEYNLTEHEETRLFQCGITNGVWVEGRNLERLIYEMVKVIEWWDHNKATAFLNDVRKLSEEHDIQYKFKMWFYRSNYKFAKKLFHLLHWWWVKRFAIFLIALILLNRYWKQFYNK